MARQEESTSALPGLLPTLAAGFDVVTRHLWLVLLPIVLDVFYWVGPQLRSTELWLSLADLFRQSGTMVDMADSLAQAAEYTNLFTFFSVPFIGVPGLMAGLVMPEQTPLQPLAWEVPDVGSWLLFVAAIVFSGLIGAAIFHSLIARSVCNQNDEQCRMINVTGQSGWVSVVRRLPVYCLRVLGMALLILLMMMALYVPLVLVAAFLTVLNAAIGSIVMLGGLAVLVWLIFYLSFGLHGILMRERPVFWALIDSIRFVQRNLLPALTLFLLIFAARNLLAWLWLLVDTGSWFTLINIAGYDFILTSLVAATYVFYRDRIALLEQG